MSDPGRQECGNGWRLIDSAPKDDPDFQALACHQASEDSWAYYIINRHDIGGRYECWVVPPGRPISPTHWQPLPSPPIDSSVGQGPPASAASHPSLASAASGMLAALERAAAQFRFYEGEHQQKAAASIWNGMTSAAATSSNKAATNREFAEMCEAAIAAARAALSKES